MSSAPIFDGDWLLMKATPYERVWVAEVSPGMYVQKRETLTHSLTAESNALDYELSEGKQWGDGQVFARVPLDIYFGKVLPMKEAGDTAGLKRFYNDPDNRWMRTFRGRI